MLARRQVIGALGALAGWPGRGVASDLWRMVTEYPATSMPGEGVQAFSDLVAQLTGQAVTIAPSFNGAGGLRSAAMLVAVSAGQLEAADAFTGALAGEAPVFQLSALPFLTSSSLDTARLLAAARPAYTAELAKRGLTLLYATPWPATGLWSREAVGPAALRGLRVRTYDAASTAVMQRVGAAPVQVSFADALLRLRSGALDAVLSSGDGGAGARLWEVLPHFTALDYASPLSLAFCRAEALASLPVPAKDAVLEAGRRTEARQFAAIGTRSAENETRMRANGVTLSVAPEVRARLQAAAGPIVAQWSERMGAEGAAILAAFNGHG